MLMNVLQVMGLVSVFLLLTGSSVAYASTTESFCEELAGATSVDGASSLEALLMEFSFGPKLAEVNCSQALQEVVETTKAAMFAAADADTCATSGPEPVSFGHEIAEHSAAWRVHELPELPKTPVGLSCDLTDQSDTCGALPPSPVEVVLASSTPSGDAQDNLSIPAKRGQTWVAPLSAITGPDPLGPAHGHGSIPEQPPRG